MKPAPTPVEILIVEDSPTQIQRLQHILEQQGYNVTSAADGREALEAVQRRKPTLIISDVVMPEMDGYELCRRIKSDPGLKDIPIILVTTLSDPEDVIRGLECRADNFILKPYDERHLLSRVQFVLVNCEVRRDEPAGMGVEIFFNGHKHFITADRLQILNLLLSTYEAAMQRNNELRHAEKELQGANSELQRWTVELEARVLQRAQELERVNKALRDENAERQQAESVIRSLNAELEQRVVERTAQLQTANEGLEAFSYSVSHDLRAPLRHVLGFVNLLKNEAGQSFTEKGLQNLTMITQSATRMGDLIDDLLAFSRIGRAELEKREINLEALVTDTLVDFRAETNERNIVWTIRPLPPVWADRALLRMVLVNLISNAVKFTGASTEPKIEIGCAPNGASENVIFIRDNGAGFDPKFAGKLFGVFQRLHSEAEFEGTGIGLANVQRIIHRHHGKTWAEGKVGLGATFYFSIPRQMDM